MDFMTPEVHEVALSLMTGLDCPRSLTVAILIRYEEWEQLVSLKCSSYAYADADAYLRAVAATDFLRKKDGRIRGLDPEGATYAKWLEAEQQCFKTNQRLNEILDFGTLSGLPCPEPILDFIERAKKYLRFLLGDRPPSEEEGRFGPGATMSDPGGRTTVAHKMSSSPTLTPSALFYTVPWVGTKWASACANRGDDLSLVRGNQYFTVPKSASVKRPCAKEPSLNGYFQLGLGSVMKRRLRSAGINLKEGQITHRQVACSASFAGDFATIDLSSASDTVSASLVKMLLPPAWFHALNDLRSSHTRVKGHWYRLEKFSSMGNGFTFELETAIFAALSMASDENLVPGHNLWVYGDDIIVPTESAPNVIAALKFFGFTTNPDKTFISGSFRESCGGDYYLGVPVRAHYLEENPYEPQHFISLANGIRRLASNFGQDSRLFADLRRTWFKCLDFIPRTIRQCRGPERLGDLCIHDSEERWTARWRSCIRYIRVYRPAKHACVSLARFDPDIQFAVALYGVRLNPQKPKRGWPEGYDNRGLALRDGVLGYKVGWVPSS